MNDDQYLRRQTADDFKTVSKGSREEREARIAAIILQSLSLRGLPFCTDDEMRVHVVAWQRVLADVPTAELDEAFALAVGKLDEGHQFTPTHIAKAYESLKRERFFESRAHSIDASDREKCGLCANEGWQRFELMCPQMKLLRVAVRPCNCERAPEALRRRDFLCEPEWSRDDRGVWLPQTLEAAARFPCECYNCKRSNYEAKARH